MAQTVDEAKKVEIDISNFKKFKHLYLLAVTNGEVQFIFEGQEVLTAYAKYVIEYWEAK